jgi:hypothetical protein
MSKILGIKSSLRDRAENAIYDSLSGVMLQGVMEKISEISDFATETVNLARSTVQMIRLNQDQSWPEMDKIMREPGR